MGFSFYFCSVFLIVLLFPCITHWFAQRLGTCVPDSQSSSTFCEVCFEHVPHFYNFIFFYNASYNFPLDYEQLLLPFTIIMRFQGTRDGIFKSVQRWISSTPKAIGALKLMFMGAKLGWHHRFRNILSVWWFCLFLSTLLSHTHFISYI